jgi:hypothetical protein
VNASPAEISPDEGTSLRVVPVMGFSSTGAGVGVAGGSGVWAGAGDGSGAGAAGTGAVGVGCFAGSGVSPPPQADVSNSVPAKAAVVIKSPALLVLPFFIQYSS